MRDHNDQLFLCYFLEKLHYLNAGVRVERARGLVGKKDLGIVHESAGYCDSLHLSARHLIRLFLQLIAKTYLLKCRDCAAASFRLGNARESQRQLDVGEYGLVRDQIIALENEAYRMVSVNVPVAVLKFLGGFTAYDEVARGVPVKTAYDVEHSGLSAARFSEDRNEFILAELQADTVQRSHLGVARGITFYDIIEFKH